MNRIFNPTQPAFRAASVTLASLSVLALAACGQAGGVSAGRPDPAGTSAATSAGTSASPPVSVSATPAGDAALELDDTGLGPLKLGMTYEEALSTGMIKPADSPPSKDDRCDAVRGLKGADLVYFQPLDKAKAPEVVGIMVRAAVPLASGLRTGDTYDEFHKVYPSEVPDHDNGRAYPAAANAPFPASYRIDFGGAPVYPDSKIVGMITLQADDQACYE